MKTKLTVLVVDPTIDDGTEVLIWKGRDLIGAILIDGTWEDQIRAAVDFAHEYAVDAIQIDTSGIGFPIAAQLSGLTHIPVHSGIWGTRAWAVAQNDV